MKKILMAALMAMIFVVPAIAADGVIDVRSDFNVQDTADRLERILIAKGMTVFNRIKHSESAGEIGIELRATELI